MAEEEILRVEASLSLELPAFYREFLLTESGRIQELEEALNYVVTPWTQSNAFINGNSAGITNSTSQAMERGDFWFIDLAKGTNEIWVFEHETDSIERAFESPEAWITSRRSRRSGTEADCHVLEA